jgi:hypothetical protein
MEKYAILIGYFDKQVLIIKKLYEEIKTVDVHFYDKRFLFALKTQQFYTAIEDLLKQIAKAFENHIDSMREFHKELLIRMNTEIPSIRPAVISKTSMLFLDKIRAFRHFIRHAYDCELDEKELKIIQDKLLSEFKHLEENLHNFRAFIQTLS